MVRESEGYVRVFITRRGRYDRSPFVVNYETCDVSARSGVDYASVHNGVVKFMEDEFEKYIDIRIIDDEEEEKEETFEISLTAVHGGS